MISHSYSNDTFHTLYLAVRKAYNENPAVFTMQECRRILSAIMAAKSFSYKVVGITESALEKFKVLDFKREKNHGIVRGHIVPIFETVKILLNGNRQFEPEEFMQFWIERDKTVFCLKNENKELVPPYMPIANEAGELFSSEGVLAGWRHRRREREFLEQFYVDYRNGKIKPVSQAVSINPTKRLKR